MRRFLFFARSSTLLATEFLAGMPGTILKE
jgi:hypothetical protein